MSVPISIADSNGTAFLQALNTAFDETIQHVGTIAALRTITPTSSSMIIAVAGYYTAADNIGTRDYYWDSTSTETDNGGTIIQVTGVTTGRWKMKYSGAVNVDWFGAGTSRTFQENTAAIEAAQQACRNVETNSGTYLVSNLRIYSKVNLSGKGTENTYFEQAESDKPAFNILSDSTVGQLLGLDIRAFTVKGHVSATVAAVKIEALGVYAVYRSNFEFNIVNCYQALNIQAYTANNVFYSTFKMDIVGTDTTSVIINGGTYNKYDFFIAQVGGHRAIEHSGFSDTFTRLVTEGQIYDGGQNTIFINPTIENIFGTPPTPYGFHLIGVSQILINPTIIMPAEQNTNITYCIKTFDRTIIENPRLLVNGVAHPFEKLVGGTSFTLIGRGQNGCANKMEAVFTCADNQTDLRSVGKVGDLSDFMDNATAYAGKNIQYLAPTGGTNITNYILNSSDMMVYEPTGVMTSINNILSYVGVARKNGQTLSIYTSQAVTTMYWNGRGSDVSLFPASMAAGQTIRFTYHLATNKWYPS